MSMHLHVEFLTIEAVLEYPERTLAEIVHSVYCISKQEVRSVGKPFLLLEKKPFFQSVKGLSYFFVPAWLSRHAN